MAIKRGQFFQQKHYDAFQQVKWEDDSAPIQRERIEVQKKFLELDSYLWPFISSQNWDLHRHRQSQHYTSSTHQVWIDTDNGQVSDAKDPVGHWQPIVWQIGSLWLHYGKSVDQLDTYNNLLREQTGFIHTNKNVSDYYNAYYLHCRIQFYLSDSVFRAWLIYANKCQIDRSDFKRKVMGKNPAFRNEYWKAIQPLLGKDFFYHVEDCDPFYLTSGLHPDDLWDYIKNEKYGQYSGIIKEYDPNDSALHELKIADEMKENLKLLYPLYLLMSTRSQIVQQQKKPSSGISGLGDAWGAKVTKK